MKKILWITNTEKRKEYLMRGLEALQSEVELKTVCEVLLVNDLSQLETLAQDLSKYSLVLVSFMSAQAGSDELYSKIYYESKIPYIFLQSSAFEVPRERGVDSTLVEWIDLCLLYSGVINIKNLWARLISVYGNEEVHWNHPSPTLDNGLYHPKHPEGFSNFESFYNACCKPNRPNVGIIFLRDDWLWGNTDIYDALILEIERQGMNAVPLFSHWIKNEHEYIEGVDEAIEKYFGSGNSCRIDVLINNFKMSMLIGRPVNKDFLKRLNVPILQAYHTRQSCEEWQENRAGLVAQEVSATVSMVEYDGVIHGVPISGQQKKDTAVYRVPMIDRIQMLVKKAKKWAILRRKNNKEKKIAIIFHNYPVTNANLGCAADLDSGESVYLLLQDLIRQGYLVSNCPKSSSELMEEVLKGLTNDHRFTGDELFENWKYRLPVNTYLTYFKSLSPTIQQEIENTWGKAPGEVFLQNQDFLISGLELGNIFVSMQPPRGFGEDAAKIIHNPDIPPTHHYFAYYLWLRDVWEADAVIHVGTHGSLEWLPGKQTGLSRECYPELALGDLPNLYPYLITIMGEGIQAKRRGAACLFGYLPAPTKTGTVAKEWDELEILMEEYSQFNLFNQSKVGIVWESIVEHIEALGDTYLLGKIEKINVLTSKELSNSLPPISEEIVEGAYQDFFLALHNRLEDLKHMQVKSGLHILGQMPDDDNLKEFIYNLVSTSNGTLEGLPYWLGRMLKVSYSDMIKKDVKSNDEIDILRLIYDYSKSFIELLAKYNYTKPEVVKNLVWLEDDFKAVAFTMSSYICDKLVPNIQAGVGERLNMLDCLNGFYVEPGPSGSPASGNIESLPTGRNFYSIDPSLIPTPAAWQLGCELGDGLIRKYISEENKYPEQVGIVVWCGPNMRSRGQDIAEILYLMGVKPVWQKGSYKVIDLEIIPLSELKRPRIDVVCRISGLVRDALPNVSTIINKAVQLVTSLAESEEENYVIKHTNELMRELEGQGRPTEEAFKNARFRVFGCPPQAYGSGVASLLENKNWQDDNDLADMYIKWGGYAYDENGNAMNKSELFARQLAKIDVTVKNETTKDLNILSSDDFFSYQGGMVAAVRAKKGMSPKSYCGDTSDVQAVQIRSAEETLQRVFYGEVLNPTYIEGMMKHGHKGAMEMAKYVSMAYGWDATTYIMSDGMYNQVASKYVFDEKVNGWMKKVNPWAAQQIVATLLEANKRELWKADEALISELQRKYLEIESSLED